MDEGQSKYVLSFSERQHIKVSETAKLIIDCFDGKKTLTDIVNHLKGQEVELSEADLILFVDTQLVSNAVLEGMEYNAKKSSSSFMWCHLPVMKSNQLAWLFQVLKVFYTKVAAVLLLSGIVGSLIFSIYMVISGNSAGQQVNSLMLILLTYTSLMLHEFGHISAAYRKGIKVGDIGVGMYMFSPVFYVDMTNTWRLGNKQRMLVDAGGMYFQLMITIPITMVGIVSGNSFYYLINLFIVSLTLANLMPFIKLDGYWIMCDFLEINNISTNAFQIIISFIKAVRGDVDENDKYGSKKRGYIMISIIYVVSSVAVLSLGSILAVKAIFNIDTAVVKVRQMAMYFADGKPADGLAQLNSTFIFLLPIMFLVIMLTKMLIGVIKGIKKQGVRK
jgi:putative peptide zinc metalloprotease protein